MDELAAINTFGLEFFFLHVIHLRKIKHSRIVNVLSSSSKWRQYIMNTQHKLCCEADELCALVISWFFFLPKQEELFVLDK